MLLELGRLTREECLEKGLIMEQMLNYVISFVNQHSKYFDMLCYNQVKNFQDSIGQI